jgi:alpha-L-rhamnosidase
MQTKSRISRREFLKDSTLAGGGVIVASGSVPSLLLGQSEPSPNAPGQKQFQLTCEYMVNPLGIDIARPRLSWKVKSSGRGETQSAYRIVVSSSQERLKASVGDKWDSGKVTSDRSFGIAYAGTPLVSSEKCHWKVFVWDEKGAVIESPTAHFEMGLLRPEEWQGKWISGTEEVLAPLFRKTVTFEEKVAQARIYISGLGYYELYINGNRIGDHVHDPGVTYYSKGQHSEIRSRVLYVTYDVSDYLKVGQNVLGVILGNGWYSPPVATNKGWLPGSPLSPFGDKPCLLMQMRVEHSSGRVVQVKTDDSWRTSTGPITYNSFINGEAYDARLEKAGWSGLGYDDSGWAQAGISQNPPDGVLSAQMLPPVRVMESIKPVRILKPKDPELFDGVRVFDMGQNFSGWTKLRVSGPPGATITLEYGANIYDDNTLDARSNLPEGSVARQTDTYILKGEGLEEWEPKFTLHGFRYVQVRGFPGTPTLESLEGRFVRSAVDISGHFSCSNDLINRIHHNNAWAFMSSCQSMPQDAADRAERVAWMGDPTFVAEDYVYNLDMSSFWSKWLLDNQDSQKANGDVPVISPIPCGHGCDELYSYPIPDWKSSYVALAWVMYRYYGDEGLLERHYESLKKMVNFLGTSSRDFLINAGLGDQMEPQDDGSSVFSALHTPVALTSSAIYYYQVWILSQVAAVLNRREDASNYSELAAKIKDAFNRKFLNETTNQYATGSQASNAVPLYLNMVPDANVRGVVANLVDDIMQTHKGHLSTGVIGTNALQQSLADYGAAEVMFQVATQTTFPAWGYQVMKGATATCETFECAPWISQNMKMLGMVEKFFYKDLGGIRPVSPAFKRIAIKPHVVGDLTFVDASVETVIGRVSASWKRHDRSFEMKIEVPVNSRAEVSVPTLGLDRFTILESGNGVWLAGKYLPGIKGISGGREDAGYVILEVGSGKYSFTVAEM